MLILHVVGGVCVAEHHGSDMVLFIEDQLFGDVGKNNLFRMVSSFERNSNFLILRN
jgi:hypothetical protein